MRSSYTEVLWQVSSGTQFTNGRLQKCVSTCQAEELISSCTPAPTQNYEKKKKV
jgi:hypothetical protein